MNTFHYSEFVKFMGGLSDYFAHTTNKEGKNICRKHGVEHVGKTVYSIAIDSFLYEETKEEKYLERIKIRVERALELHTLTSDGWVFKPNFGNRWNMSQYIIDTGAVVDMLGLVLDKHKNLFSNEEIKKIKAALSKSADTYLVEAVISKPPTNQRLWGATGLATYYHLEPKASYEEALLRSLEKSWNEIRADGSIPYVTDYANYGMDESANDVTSYYHSRHVSYFWQVLDIFPEVKEKYGEKLLQATDFLIGIHQADGKKSMALETKHWYFLSGYEVASNSYDTNALLRAYQETGDKKYADYALSSLALLMKHQATSGAITDHFGKGSNFQCPYFWSSHTAWLTKVASILKELDGREFSFPKPVTKLYTESGLAQLSDGKTSVMVRGSKTPYSPCNGPKVGGGALIYTGFEKDGFRNVIESQKLVGNWHFKTRPSLFYIEFAKWTDIKAMVYYALIELRRGYIKGFLERSFVALFRSFSLSKHYSSGFATKVDMELIGENELIIENGTISLPNGTSYEGITLERRYRIENGKLTVIEKASHDSSNPPNITYRFPKNSKIITKSEIMVSYELC